jgi:hypothetical protein
MRQVKSVSSYNRGDIIFFRIVIMLTSVNDLNVAAKGINYQYIVSYDPTNEVANMIDSMYLNLRNPNFVVLNNRQVEDDQNIMVIVDWLLNQKDKNVQENSKIVSVERDFPFYRVKVMGVDQKVYSFVVIYKADGNM